MSIYEVNNNIDMRHISQLNFESEVDFSLISVGNSMANAWKREKPKFTAPKIILFLLLISTLLLFSSFLYYRSSNQNPTPDLSTQFSTRKIPFFDCQKSPQAHPIIANVVENLKYPFIYGLADLGNLPEKPHKNIVRMLKGKAFRKPDISSTIQERLDEMKANGRNGLVVDVGANVGMATFAAAVMGFQVLAFEPVFENLQRICDGIWFNRVPHLVTVFEAAASDQNGNITFHKLVGRLDNSAVSASGAKLAFKSNKEIAVEVRSIRLDEVISESESVVLVKIDVQGWEYHVLKGAEKLLSRSKSEAPYLIYEEDERLLQASNSSVKQIRDFLQTLGYTRCTQHGTDAHCTKD